jgi:hypothetical protein
MSMSGSGQGLTGAGRYVFILSTLDEITVRPSLPICSYFLPFFLPFRFFTHLLCFFVKASGPGHCSPRLS